MSYRALPFRFFAFPWSAGKLRFTWTPKLCRDGAFWSLAWLGFEFGQLPNGEGRGT